MKSFINSIIDFLDISISKLSKTKFLKSEHAGEYLKTIDSLANKLSQYYYDNDEYFPDEYKLKVINILDGLNQLKEEIIGIPKHKYDNLSKKFNSGFLNDNGVTIVNVVSRKASKKISDIEGIGPKYAAKLQKAGIRSVAGLLKSCVDKKSRKLVSKQTGIGEPVLLRWASMADLFRIKGVGSEYSELLEAAGVDTVKALRNRNSDNLHAKMVEINAKKKLVRQLPSASKVADFVKQAKELNPIVIKN